MQRGKPHRMNDTGKGTDSPLLLVELNSSQPLFLEVKTLLVFPVDLHIVLLEVVIPISSLIEIRFQAVH